jgi:hypothetical protein
VSRICKECTAGQCWRYLQRRSAIHDGTGKRRDTREAYGSHACWLQTSRWQNPSSSTNFSSVKTSTVHCAIMYCALSQIKQSLHLYVATPSLHSPVRNWVSGHVAKGWVEQDPQARSIVGSPLARQGVESYEPSGHAVHLQYCDTIQVDNSKIGKKEITGLIYVGLHAHTPTFQASCSRRVGRECI